MQLGEAERPGGVLAGQRNRPVAHDHRPGSQHCFQASVRSLILERLGLVIAAVLHKFDGPFLRDRFVGPRPPTETSRRLKLRPPRLTVAEEPKPRKAKDHHRPCRRFRHDARGAAGHLHLVGAVTRIGLYGGLDSKKFPPTPGPVVSNEKNQLTVPADAAAMRPMRSLGGSTGSAIASARSACRF